MFFVELLQILLKTFIIAREEFIEIFMEKDRQLNNENRCATGQYISFDAVAKSYLDMMENLSEKVGYSVEYFTEYKVLDLIKEHKNSTLKNKNDLKILNYGCGIGLSDFYISKNFPNAKIFCCDISTKSLEIAQSRGKNLDNVSYAVCDGIKLPFEENFDIIFIANVLRHIPKQFQTQTLQMLQKSLSDDGFIMIYEFNPYNPVSYYFYKNEDLKYDKYNCRILSAKKLKELLKNSGFENFSLKYRFFIPPFLKQFSQIENYLLNCPLGANYYFVAKKSPH